LEAKNGFPRGKTAENMIFALPDVANVQKTEIFGGFACPSARGAAYL
jgi:hypothetical protein